MAQKFNQSDVDICHLPSSFRFPLLVENIWKRFHVKRFPFSIHLLSHVLNRCGGFDIFNMLSTAHEHHAVRQETQMGVNSKNHGLGPAALLSTLHAISAARAATPKPGPAQPAALKSFIIAEISHDVLILIDGAVVVLTNAALVTCAACLGRRLQAQVAGLGRWAGGATQTTGTCRRRVRPLPRKTGRISCVVVHS